MLYYPCNKNHNKEGGDTDSITDTVIQVLTGFISTKELHMSQDFQTGVTVGVAAMVVSNLIVKLVKLAYIVHKQKKQAAR